MGRRSWGAHTFDKWYNFAAMARSRIVKTPIRCLGVSFRNFSCTSSLTMFIEFALGSGENFGITAEYVCPFLFVVTPLRLPPSVDLRLIFAVWKIISKSTG